MILILLLLPIISRAQQPGAHYFADSDGNGTIEVPDLIVLNTVLGDSGADDTLIYSGYPQSRYRQDLDGNGVIEIPDMIILNSWVPGDFSNKPGNPDRIILDGDTHPNLIPGNSVTIAAYALSPVAAGSQVRTGFGVIFKIDPASTCTTAQIRGYDVAGGATINAWRSNAAYHYTLQPGAPDNGRASVRVNANGCSGGQVIKVEVYIPDDIEAGVVPGRFPTKLSTTQRFNVTVVDTTPPDTFITAYPPDPDNSQESTFEFTCSESSCTYECKLDSRDWQACSSPKSYSNENWMPTSLSNAPFGRECHTAVWTGTEMIIWGGYDGSFLNSGGRYNPATDSWTATSTTNAPDAGRSHAAVWTGTEMIVWGGEYYSGGWHYLNTGGRYNPSSDSWTATSTANAPSARNVPTAIWTGTEMIVWGGHGGTGTVNTGGRYNPSNNSWTPTTTTNSPSAKGWHTAVWTGTEMIVWGGYGDGIGYENTGGRYNSATDSWVATSTANAPSERGYHTAVWTGIEMIVWGGYVDYSPYELNTGGIYNPVSDSWTETSTTDAPVARDSHTAVWTGAEMIVWGGIDINSDYLNTGGRYNPLADSWIATSTANAPSPRVTHTAVWTGSKMIVWGGEDNTYNEINDGSIYTTPMQDLGLDDPIEGDHSFQVRAYDLAMNVDPTPATYTWTVDLTNPDTSIDSFPYNPSNSSDASFSFSCNETNCTFECKMDSGSWEACASPKNYTGLSDATHTFQVRAMDLAGNIDQTPASYTWKIDTIAPNTTINSAPDDPTSSSDAQFTFSCNEPGCIFECNLDSLGWEPCTSPTTYTSLLVMPHTFEVRATDPAGNTDQTPASYSWTIDQTPPDTFITSNPPDPDTHNFADFSFSCNEPSCSFECNLDSGGWGSCTSPKHFVELANGSHNFSVRAIDLLENIDPSPATYSWTINSNPPDTFITSNPPDPFNRPNAAFEFSCSQASCTYECKLDLDSWESCTSPKSFVGAEGWVATLTSNSPSARRYHHAVWTGSEMIIWGGNNGSSLNTGGRYNPVTDSWTATSTGNAPSGRFSFAAVWTGTTMIVWGGSQTINTGGRYNPATNSWTAISTTNAPSGRYAFPAVWTGTEMILWGGYGSSPSLKGDGSKYNPSNDSWTAITTTNAPLARSSHAMVWTGTRMIVWGGWRTGEVPLNTGAVYNPFEDSWTVTSTGANTPAARWDHNLVWTGTEMIVWGGYSGSRMNTGGKYNPDTDSWLPTTTTNAPSARSWAYCSLGSVWTGTEMIIWGGDNGSPYANDGGRYNPLTDTWTATMTTNAPSGRYGADIIWTGKKMIAWGGYDGGYLKTGGQYDPGYGNLLEGAHTFAVRAYDLAMNVDLTPATYPWTIDLTTPDTSITVYPPNPSNSPDAVFEFTCNEANCSFECKLDSGEWSSCSSPKDYAGLSDGIQTFQVRAIDAAGNIDQTPAIYCWRVDILAPNTAIDFAPPDPSSSSSAQFYFSCNESNCTFECNLDSAGWEPCASPVNYDNLLPVVLHTFEVRATDIFEQTDPTPAGFSWTIDITPPETSITFTPPDPANYNFADFFFTCNEMPCTFVCLLDSTGWDSCSSPKHYSSLENGSHTFRVYAYDSAGNIDSTPATYTWTVNANPPDTFITSQPPNPSNTKNPSFEFNCSPGPCTYECKLDSQGWEACVSPRNYTGLSDAAHTFQVRAVDLDNNYDLTPASYAWTIDTIPPWTSITDKPNNPSSSSSASFSYTCSGGPCTFECRLDSPEWTACISPSSYSGLVDGSHTFDVRAKDAAGNYDATPESYTWTIDTLAPDTFINSHPSNPNNLANAVFEFSCNEPNCTFRCKLDSELWQMCSSPMEYPQDEAWFITSTSGAPSARNLHVAVWTGTEMIVWGGCASFWLNTGGKYNPSTDTWTATSTTGAPPPTLDPSAVWTGAEMILWGGYASGYTNSGARYNPATDSWSATTTTNAPAGRRYCPAVWTGAEMIIWGGYNHTYLDPLNTGGRYNPATDSWTATSMDCPSSRYAHAAVWTGTEMIVWGGYPYTNTGGRYNPITDSWTSTTITNAPTGRQYFSAVWTGTEMIVWGGANGSYLNTGGRYNPVNDSWAATSTANAPSIREYHTAVWTGTEMIVWGGHGSLPTYKNDGGRYSPSTDNWAATATSDAPSSRAYNTAVWTGTEMIVWGGYYYDSSNQYLNTGGVYNPFSGVLTEGDHTFQVFAYDLAMNVDPTPATYNWTIDLTPPETYIDSAPPDPTNSPDATFEFSCNETGCSFECKIDSEDWSSCESPQEYLGLSDGDHEFSVRAIDPATNIDPTPAIYTWTIASP